MCKYRYHYYSQCQHQELLCFELCDRAEPLLKRIKVAGQDIALEGANGDQDDQADTSKPFNTNYFSPTITSVNSPFVAPQHIEAGAIYHDPSFAQHQQQPLINTINHPSHTPPREVDKLPWGLKSCSDVRIPTPLTSKVCHQYNEILLQEYYGCQPDDHH